MPEEISKVDQERNQIIAAKEKGTLATVGVYTRLSGPGWLQSALTLGGGSLASSLFLGVLAGFSLLWLQPMAMILGIIMLSAIGYVAMSTTERPFQAINRHVNPVLGWGWALASLAANMVWALPQYSLASGVLQQNLLPGVLGAESPIPDFWCKVIISVAILIITTLVTFTYDSGGWGVKAYEMLLKAVVAGIVFCFVGVVCVLSWEGTLNWGEIFRGFIPDLTKIFHPAVTFDWLLAAVPSANNGFWVGHIVDEQRDVMISAAATAVGINMTFLLPYSMLRRGWDKNFRGLAMFDLSTGMFIPFVLATSCVVIASATQFHVHVDGQSLIQLENQSELPPLPEFVVKKLTTGKLEQRLGAEEFDKLSPEAREEMGAPEAAKKKLGKAEIDSLSDEQIEKEAVPLTDAETLLAQRLIVSKYNLEPTKVAGMSEDELRHDLADLGWADLVAARQFQIERLKERLGNEEVAKMAPAAQAIIPTDLRHQIGGALVKGLSPEEIDSQLTPLTQSDLLLVSHMAPKPAFALANKMAKQTTIFRLKEELGKEEFAKLSAADIEKKIEPLTPAEALLGIHMQRKNAFDLAKSLKPLTGQVVANFIFGIGVLGMTISSITLLMLISGFVICEILGLPPTGWPNRLGTLAAATGVLGPFLWSGTTRFWLAVPTSVFGMILLPIAYITFFCMMNSKNLLGDQMPRGGRRWAWNLSMGVAAAAAIAASVYMVWVKASYYGLAGVGAFLLLVLVVHFAFPRKSATASKSDGPQSDSPEPDSPESDTSEPEKE